MSAAVIAGPRRSSPSGRPPLDPRAVENGKPPPDPDEAISWLHGGAKRLIDAVEQTGVETPVWTFLGPRPAYWWVRRRLHEATVHRADAALALGLDYALAPELAADGIGEWLERVASQAGRDDAPLPLEDGQTLHLRATDPGLGVGGRWTIRSDAGRIIVVARRGQRHSGAARRRRRPAAGAAAASPVDDTDIAVSGDAVDMADLARPHALLDAHAVRFTP